MKKKNLLIALGTAAALFLIIAVIGCSGIATGINKVADAITKPTAREVYSREFKDNPAAYDAWETAYKNARQDSLTVSLPYGEKGTFNPNANLVYSYTVTLAEGEILVAEVARDSVSQQVFMDILEVDNPGVRQLTTNEDGGNTVTYTPANAGTYRVIIQPEMAANSDFFITLRKNPLYATFPVAGKGNAAIGSFWGMERDGGKRSHEGIDIFAKKGTPVVAVTDGFVSYTGERGLGGKQVWLRDGLFGASLYYAHLDSIIAQSGARVHAGDTLGLVGNTGNAQFTPAHLHFGIYRNSGAVNPLPYVFTNEKISQQQFNRSYKTQSLKVKGTANLRQGPSATAPVIGTAGANESITLLGQSKDWLHVQTALGKKAFISKTLIKV